jgi:hypothetical protein
MSFLVNFRSAEGKQGYHPTDTLEEAVRFVEHLRNQEHVADARVWRLQDVALEVKTYYKVEVVSPAPEPVASRPVEDEARPEPVAVAAASEPMATVPPSGPEGSNGVSGPNSARFGRFNRT